MAAGEFRLSIQIPSESWPLSHWAADRALEMDNLYGIPQVSPPKPLYPFVHTTSQCGSWMIFTPGEDRQNVVMQLLRDSWAMFKNIRLETWVEQAIGLPAVSLVIFETFHDRLAFSLFTFLRRFPDEATKYQEVAQASGL